MKEKTLIDLGFLCKEIIEDKKTYYYYLNTEDFELFSCTNLEVTEDNEWGVLLMPKKNLIIDNEDTLKTILNLNL